jgi:thioredoxin reductase
MYDTIVIGGGPAGLSAAIWLARYRRKVLLLDEGKGRNRWTEIAHGYLGIDPADPENLKAEGLRHLAGYSTAEIREGRATGASQDNGEFVVTMGSDDLRARRLVLATGVVDEFPDIDNFFEHYGASVFHCPTCDGYEARDKRIVVFGWSELVASFSLELMNWARSVTVVSDGRSFEGHASQFGRLRSNGVEVCETTASGLTGRRGDLQVRLNNGELIECDFAFFTIQHHPGAGLAEGLGCEMTGEDCVAVDSACATSVPGIYAAGDITPGLQLIQIAASKGAIAGIECAQSFFGEPTAPGAPDSAPDLEARP